MTPLEAWFPGWLAGHLARHVREGLPAATSEEGPVLYGAWLKLFRKHGVHDRDVAEEASERLLAEPPRHPRQHFSAILAHAREVYVARAAAGDPGRDPSSSREAAEAAARGCPRCQGAGLVPVWHPRPDPARRVPATVAAYCVCAMGRWVERTHREKSPDVRARMVDLADALAGRGPWRADPPALAGLPAVHALRRPPARPLPEEA